MGMTRETARTRREEIRLSMGGKTWTAERTELLRSLWADGIPGGVIAHKLGMSRGMVAGKRASLGLPPRLGAVGKAAMRANGRRTAALLGHVKKADPAAVQMRAEKAANVEKL